jgi:hypothetical protein
VCWAASFSRFTTAETIHQQGTNMKITQYTVLLGTLTLAACASTTPTRELTQGYAIFDVQVSSEVPPSRIADAVRTALQKHMSAVQITNGIPPSPLPESMPRFQLVSPFKSNSGMGAIAASQGAAMQVPVCEGAILTANARDSSMRRYGEGTTFFACLMPYRRGYALNIYTTFSKASGAFNAEVLAATLMRPLVGDSSQFIPRVIAEVVDAVKQAGATARVVEAYP